MLRTISLFGTPTSIFRYTFVSSRAFWWLHDSAWWFLLGQEFLPVWINWRCSFASTFASKLIKLQMNLPPPLPLTSCSACCFLLFKDVFGYWQVIVSLLAGLRSKTGLGQLLWRASSYLMTTLLTNSRWRSRIPYFLLAFFRRWNLIVLREESWWFFNLSRCKNQCAHWEFPQNNFRPLELWDFKTIAVATVIWLLCCCQKSIAVSEFFFWNYPLEQLVFRNRCFVVITGNESLWQDCREGLSVELRWHCFNFYP